MSNSKAAADLALALGASLVAGDTVSAEDRALIHANCWDHLMGSELDRRGLRTEWRTVDGAYDGSLLVVAA